MTPAATLAVSDAAPADDRGAADRRLLFAINIVAVLFLQRFGVIAGGSEFFLCFAIFLATVCWGAARGSIRIRPPIAGLYLLVAFCFAISTLVALLVPRGLGALSITSLVGVLLFNIVFLFAPTAEDREGEGLRLFLGCARIICGLGILQYALQFVGIRLFTLGKVIPALRPILVEANYNTEGVQAWGSAIQRANGIVLLEPGAFSQMIAIALLIDLFLRRKLAWLPLYGVAYILSYSGTGLLSLALALAISAVVVSGQRRYIAAAAIVGVPLLALLAIAAPEKIAMLTKRTAEFNQPGTSGYLRYVAQAQAWRYFGEGWRAVTGTGPGAFERSPVYVIGSGSAAIKLFAEYGLIGLSAFTAFIVSAVWNRPVALLSIMMLVIYQFGGGNLLQPPTLILMTLLCTWTGTGVPLPEGDEP